VRSIPYRLIAVEAEPTHFEFMQAHFKDNVVDPQRYRLVRAAVAARDGTVWSYVGRPAEWYGQAVAPSPDLPRVANWLRRATLPFLATGSVGNESVKKVRA